MVVKGQDSRSACKQSNWLASVTSARTDVVVLSESACCLLGPGQAAFSRPQSAVSRSWVIDHDGRATPMM